MLLCIHIVPARRDRFEVRVGAAAEDSRGGLLADCPPPHGLLARAMPRVEHEAAMTASNSAIALRAPEQQCAVCSVLLFSNYTDAISIANSTRVLCRCVLWVCEAGRPLLC